MVDFKPSDAVEGDETAADPASGMESEQRPPGFLDALFNTEGGAPVGEIENEYETDRPTALVIRGTMKLAGENGFPAVADLTAGLILLSLRLHGGFGGGGGGGSGDAFEDDFTDREET